AGGQVPADHGGEDQPQRGEAPGGEEHGGDGGDQQQLDDARLGQRHVSAEHGARRARGTATATSRVPYRRSLGGGHRPPSFLLSTTRSSREPLQSRPRGAPPHPDTG